MNYHDYLEIMRFEELEESLSVRSYLESAIYWQKAIKQLVYYDLETQEKLRKDFEERKIQGILRGIEVARFEKELGFRIEEDYEELMVFIGNGGLLK